MNADGIYLATYSALLLDLKLIQCGQYEDKSVPVPITEAQFVEEIHGSGVLVYVSATWLCELYQNVLAKSLLLSNGYDPKSAHQPSLVNLLTGALFKNVYISYILLFKCFHIFQILVDYVHHNYLQIGKSYKECTYHQKIVQKWKQA